MRILLSVLHFGLLRNFESVVRALSDRGHEVVLLADEDDAFGGQSLADVLSLLPGVSHGRTPSYGGQAWFIVARKIRQGLDYLRFLDRRYAPFTKLRQRAEERAPRFVTGLMRAPILPILGIRQVLMSVLTAIEGGMPRLEAMDTFLDRARPDVILFCSVTHPRAAQIDHLRSARSKNIPTGVCVYSWDHLSSKAQIRVMPDRVFVWNETQRSEAVKLHGIPVDRVVVTGAQVYDQWFNRSPSRSREQFLVDMGLPPDRPFVLYVCSAMTPDPNEAKFVRRWVESIRGSGHPRLQNAGVVVRPHPERRREWENVVWSDLGPLVVTGANPIQASAKADYFDALAYSEAVVGIVTSSFLEAAVVGRPVLTITPPEFRSHQMGMLHFRYLVEIEGGLLKVGTDLDEHVRHLEDTFDGDVAHRVQQQRFLRAFVRPLGLEHAATPRFVEMIESLAVSRLTNAPIEVPFWKKILAHSVVYVNGLGLLVWAMTDAREAVEERTRSKRIDDHRRAHRLKWRRHRRRKMLIRLQGVMLRVYSIAKKIDRKRKLYVHRSFKFTLRVLAGLRRFRRDVGTL
jgi:hypothetical protein